LKATAFLKAQSASERTGSIVDTAGIAMQQPFSLKNVMKKKCGSVINGLPAEPSR
jgi:hypothetical protein